MRLWDKARAALHAWRTPEAAKSVAGFDWGASDLPGNRYTSTLGRTAHVPGTSINWERYAEDLLTCPAVQAAVLWKQRNWAQAPAQVVSVKRDGTTTPIAGHPLLALLARPNPDYDGDVLLSGVISDLDTRGNAFVTLEYNGAAQVAELRYRPWLTMNVVSLPDTPEVIDHYEYNNGRAIISYPVEDVIHYRVGVNPKDVRLGLSPLLSGIRDTVSLQQTSNYTANILKNFGTVGGMVWPKDPNMAFEPKEFADLLRQRSQGDNVGDWFATDVPLEVTYPGVTPQSMALDTIADRPESNLCALLGIPPQVLGLHVGRLSKTYANAQQAKEAAWEEGMMPLGYLIACQTWYRLGPMLSPQTYKTERLAWDYSQVRALQPDLDALYKRANDAWKLNAISLAEWKTMVGMTPQPGDDTTYYRDVAGGAQLPDTIPGSVPGDPPVKGLQFETTNWAERVEAELAVLHRLSA